MLVRNTWWTKGIKEGGGEMKGGIGEEMRESEGKR